MIFIVTGYDHTDAQALQRRMDAREAHMSNIRMMKEKGQILFAAAMLNEQGHMCGSNMILEMASKEEVDAYLSIEPYMLQNVWERVDIKEGKVPDLFR